MSTVLVGGHGLQVIVWVKVTHPVSSVVFGSLLIEGTDRSFLKYVIQDFMGFSLSVGVHAFA